MKRLCALFLALVMCCSLMACRKSTEIIKNTTNPGEATNTMDEPILDTTEDTSEETTLPTEASEKETTTGAASDKASAVADYVKEHEEELISEMEAGLTSSGLTCDSSIKTEGAGFIIDLKIQELEDVDDATKDELQKTYDSMSVQFEDALEEMQKELPELEYYTFYVCDKNGDVLATVHASGQGGSSNVVEDAPTIEPTIDIDIGVDDGASVAQYIEENKADLLATFESSFATSSGMTCTSDIKVKGNGFIIDININELEDVPDETKEQIQDVYDSMGSSLDASLEAMQLEIPELEYYTINVREKDGDLVAALTIGND